MEDTELLCRYATEKSEEAFAELVRRRVDFVYTVALRHVGGDAHLAEDVTQKVFTDLARKAPELARRAVLSGWLYRGAQYAASDAVRAERRRRAREEESHAMHDLNSSPASPADWEKLRPLLDRALGELDDEDRDAVALRFFEEKPFAEIGRTLRLSEDTARKRVERALERLGAALSRRGVTSTSGALGLALGSQAIVAAPAGLATAVTGVALAGSATTVAAASAGGLVLGFMSATKAVGVAGAVAVLAVGGAFYGIVSVRESRAALVSAVTEHAEAEARLGELESRLAATLERAQAAEHDLEALRKAIEDARRSRPAPLETAQSSGPITRELVESRYNRGRDLAREGNWVEALPELLWCFDEGMKQVGGYTGVRVSFLLGEIMRIAPYYPPTLEAIRLRRDQAETRMKADANDRAAFLDYSALTRRLGEEDKLLAFHDQLPQGDPRRASLGQDLFRTLLESRRYADVVAAQSYDRMLARFNSTLQDSERPTAVPAAQRSLRALGIESAAQQIEALAGAGQLANARAFAVRVLAVDNSPETRALLREHVTRAGQPALLETAAP